MKFNCYCPNGGYGNATENYEVKLSWSLRPIWFVEPLGRKKKLTHFLTSKIGTAPSYKKSSLASYPLFSDIWVEWKMMKVLIQGKAFRIQNGQTDNMIINGTPTGVRSGSAENSKRSGTKVVQIVIFILSARTYGITPLKIRHSSSSHTIDALMGFPCNASWSIQIKQPVRSVLSLILSMTVQSQYFSQVWSLCKYHDNPSTYRGQKRKRHFEWKYFEFY